MVCMALRTRRWIRARSALLSPPKSDMTRSCASLSGSTRPPELGHPELDAVVPQERGGEPVLGAGEGALGLADYEGVESAILAGAVGEEAGCFRSARPGQRTRDADVEVVGDDVP